MTIYNRKKSRQIKTASNEDVLIPLILNEMSLFGIVLKNSSYEVSLGDETAKVNSLQEVHSLIKSGLKELKTYLFELWEDLNNIANILLENSGGNTTSLDNLIFLNAIKKAFYLSKKFPELKNVNSTLLRALNTDIADVHPDVIRKFNHKFIEIKVVHQVILNELYRLRLIGRISTVTKQAQISGPWANLDLPMKERVWEWSEGEDEYFDNRTKARREQTRYNPETNKQGFYFVWQDLSTSPYRFEDMDSDSPYKSRGQISIP